MSNRLFVFTPLLLLISVLAGCQAKSASNSESNSTANRNLMPSQQYDYDKQLKQCIAEGDYIAKKNRAKYGQTNNALIQILSGVKAYSSQLSQIDEKNKEIITSLYVYQVNDLCNSISQFYLAEVKKELKSIVDKIK